MKFVFTKEEVANALSMPVAEFEQSRLELEATDFPKPIVGLRERWSIIDVINWVNRSTPSGKTATGYSKCEFGNQLN